MFVRFTDIYLLSLSKSKKYRVMRHNMNYLKTYLGSSLNLDEIKKVLDKRYNFCDQMKYCSILAKPHYRH